MGAEQDPEEDLPLGSNCVARVRLSFLRRRMVIAFRGMPQENALLGRWCCHFESPPPAGLEPAIFGLEI